jgi:hypothetical protein
MFWANFLSTPLKLSDSLDKTPFVTGCGDEDTDGFNGELVPICRDFVIDDKVLAELELGNGF